MNLVRLVLAFIRRRPATWALQVATLALGVALVVSLILVERGVQERFRRDLAGVDLVIGAKGSPLQIVLSSLFEMDTPTGNIPLTEAQRFSHHYLVKDAVPISIGDSFAGYRIVGSSPQFADLYQVKLAAGRWWTRPLEAVVGSAVAQAKGLRLGQTFIGEHGLSGGELHKDYPYTVVGILAPAGAAPDRLVLTDTSSVWKVHEKEEEEEAAAISGGPLQPRPKEVTALLVRYRSAMGAVILPQMVKATPDLQAAVPAVEVARLFRLLGFGAQVVVWIGLLLLLLSAAGFLVSLLGAISQRRRELALLRALGAGPGLLLALVGLEAIALGLAGGAMGVAAARLLVQTLAGAAVRQGAEFAAPAFGPVEGSAILIAVGLALLAAGPSAWIAARTDPARELASS